MDPRIKLDVEGLEIDSFATEPVVADPVAAAVYQPLIKDPTAATRCFVCPAYP